MMNRRGGEYVGTTGTQHGCNSVNGVNNCQSSKGLNKWALFGLGGALGLGGGIGLGIHLGKKEALKRAKEALKTVRKEGYDEGWDDGFDQASHEAQAWIDENILVVDGNTPEEVAENAAEAMKAREEAKKQDEEKTVEQTISETEKPMETVNKFSEAYTNNDDTKFKTLWNKDDDAADMLVDMDRKAKINKVTWMYKRGVPTLAIARITGYPDDFVKSITKDLGDAGDVVEIDEDIDNYDLSIDEEDEEAREMTEARERYLDEVERYLGNPSDGPHYISSEDFAEEAYLDKVYVDYFETDNVFVSNEDASQELDDPVTDFGTADGKELFANNPHREDEDIVTMRNFAQNAVYEITRYHEAYASVRDGSAYLHGSSANV